MTSVASVVLAVIWVYSVAIIVRSLMTWLPLKTGSASYRVYSFLYDVTEPYLGLFRRLLPPARGGRVAVDFSPMVGLVVLYVVYRVIAAL
jgi:YggT family protein